MKTCPECLNQVTDVARACKYCGYIFDDPRSVEPAPLPNPTKTNSNSVMKNLNLMLFFLVILIVAFYLFLTSRTPSTPKPTEDPATPIDAVIMCEQFVKDNLKAPKTADFQNIYQAESTETTPDSFTVKSYVDSENSFGAMIRTNFKCQIRFTGDDNWQLIDLAFDD